ncbi:zinc finger domain-containing protein [Methanoculleus bourgensis]|uniref:zinc finger domain-containing protein n=2 Tax=Methanomicrobiaceae TaxID=2194 RepID=UPI00373AEAC6
MIGNLRGKTMTARDRCTSCNATLAETGCTRFPCPECEHEIQRCYRCREQSIAYTCPNCGFRGP